MAQWLRRGIANPVGEILRKFDSCSGRLYLKEDEMKLIKPKKQELEIYVNLETKFFKHHKPYGTLLQDISPEKRNLKKEFEGLIKQKNAFFRFAEFEGKVAGYIYGLIEKIGDNEKGWKKKGELNSIVILPEFRGKGIAKFMTNEFLSWLKSKGIRYAEMSCNVKNTGMLKFAKKLKFKEQHIKFGKLL